MVRSPQEKADPALVAKLASASAREELTVILEIVEPDSRRDQDLEKDVSTNERAFARTPGEPKKASQAYRPVLDQLTDLGLRPRGGRYAPVVVVTGRPDAVREALALDSVSRATLDDSLDLIAPERPGVKKPE